jgi:hypothetical protein
MLYIPGAAAAANCLHQVNCAAAAWHLHVACRLVACPRHEARHAERRSRAPRALHHASARRWPSAFAALWQWPAWTNAPPPLLPPVHALRGPCASASGLHTRQQGQAAVTKICQSRLRCLLYISSGYEGVELRQLNSLAAVFRYTGSAAGVRLGYSMIMRSKCAPLPTEAGMRCAFSARAPSFASCVALNCFLAFLSNAAAPAGMSLGRHVGHACTRALCVSKGGGSGSSAAASKPQHMNGRHHTPYRLLHHRHAPYVCTCLCKLNSSDRLPVHVDSVSVSAVAAIAALAPPMLLSYPLLLSPAC